MDFTSVNFKGTVFLFGGYQAAVSEAVWTMNNETFEFFKVFRTEPSLRLKFNEPAELNFLV